MNTQAAGSANAAPGSFPEAAILHLGIFCCAVTMVIVLAVAVFAS
jgi:hypothetical protein